MKILASLLALLAASLAVAGESGINAPGYYSCRSHIGTGKIVYFAAVFEGDGTIAGDVQRGFAQMLASKYGFHGDIDCPMAYKRTASPQKLVADDKSYAQQLRSQGDTVIETGWTYNGAPAIADQDGGAPQAGNPAAAQPAVAKAAAAIDGVYEGTYTCAIGPRTLKLALNMTAQWLEGVFTFYVPPTSHTQGYSFILRGTFDPPSGKFKLTPLKWEGTDPGGYAMVGLNGVFDASAAKVTGQIDYSGCSGFEATRGAQ